MENNINQSPSICDDADLEENSSDHSFSVIQKANGQKRNRLLEMSMLTNLVSQPSCSRKFTRKNNRENIMMNSRKIYTLEDRTFSSSLNVTTGDINTNLYFDRTDFSIAAASSNDPKCNLSIQSFKRSASLGDITFVAETSHDIGT